MYNLSNVFLHFVMYYIRTFVQSSMIYTDNYPLP